MLFDWLNEQEQDEQSPVVADDNRATECSDTVQQSIARIHAILDKGARPRSEIPKPAKSLLFPCEDCDLSEHDEFSGILWCCAEQGHYQNVALLRECQKQKYRTMLRRQGIVFEDGGTFAVNPEALDRFGCRDCDAHIDGWCLAKNSGSQYNIQYLDGCPRGGVSASFAKANEIGERIEQ